MGCPSSTCDNLSLEMRRGIADFLAKRQKTMPPSKSIRTASYLWIFSTSMISINVCSDLKIGTPHCHQVLPVLMRCARHVIRFYMIVALLRCCLKQDVLRQFQKGLRSSFAQLASEVQKLGYLKNVKREAVFKSFPNL